MVSATVAKATDRSVAGSLCPRARLTRRPMPRLANLGFSLLCAVACSSSFHGCWMQRQMNHGQVFRGYFESSNGRMHLAFTGDAPAQGMSFPAPGPNQDESYGVPPGTVVAIPLRAGVTYRISGAPPGLLPYILLGDLAPLPTKCVDLVELCGDGMQLVAPAQLVYQKNRASLAPWQSGNPWQLDEAWLKQLAKGCSAPDGDITLTRHDNRISVRAGSCTTEHQGAGGDTVVAVVAGPSFSFIRTTRPDWRYRTSLDPLPLGLTAGLGAIGASAATAVFGLNGAVALALGIVGLYFWDPFVVRFGSVALTVALVSAWTIMTIRRLFGPRAMFGCVGIAVSAIGALCLYAAKLRPERSTLRPVVRESSAAVSNCLVTGYSTAHGEGTRERGLEQRFDPTGGTNDLLTRSCPPCRSRTMTIAEGGETFLFVRNAVCGEPRLAQPGTVIFLGGANDDLLSWRDSRSPAWAIFARLATGVVSLNRGDFDEEKLFSLWDRASASSFDEIEDHVERIRQAIQCSRRRGERFIFVNNFIVTDLLRGRSDSRQRITAARKSAVEAEGGVFVDLLETLGPRAGVAWFNDFVHPSLEMHRHIADVVCRRIEDEE